MNAILADEFTCTCCTTKYRIECEVVTPPSPGYVQHCGNDEERTRVGPVRRKFELRSGDWVEVSQFRCPHWVNEFERKPELEKKVQVIAVRRGYDIEYDIAKVTSDRGWVSLTDKVGTEVAAWLESDRVLDDDELNKLSKLGIRRPVR